MRKIADELLSIFPLRTFIGPIVELSGGKVSDSVSSAGDLLKLVAGSGFQWSSADLDEVIQNYHQRRWLPHPVGRRHFDEETKDVSVFFPFRCEEEDFLLKLGNYYSFDEDLFCLRVCISRPREWSSEEADHQHRLSPSDIFVIPHYNHI